jgi:hypothetical protein
LTAHRNGEQVSRRLFLAGAGVAAEGGILKTSLVALRAFTEPKSDQAIIGPDAVPMTVRINGAGTC